MGTRLALTLLALAVMAACRPEGPPDCDDEDTAIGPGRPETCDGADNDCDTVIDEPDAVDAVLWYADADGDGYGREDSTTRACTQPNGYAPQAGDCDDTDPDVNPGGAETCDGQDEDCDGVIDENPVDAGRVYRDADGDGYGDDAVSMITCNAPSGFVVGGGDCDDGDPAIHPDALELCNLLDDDCDGDADEGDDLDGDGVAVCDCDETDPYVHPGAEEACGHSLDDDCDGYPMECGVSGTLLASEADGVIYGGYDYYAYGSVAVGDVDGDGEAEVLLGEPTDTGWDGVGHLFLDPVFGEHHQDEAPVHLVRPASGDLASTEQAAVVALGDLDVDGFDDVLLGDAGSYGWSGGGAVLLFYSPLLGEEDISLADATLQSTEEDDAFSDSLVTGDLTGDGVGDVIVGAPGLYGHAAIDGSVYVFAGPPMGTLSPADAAVTLHGESGSQAGVSATGDVDGDGLDDLLVGAPSCADGDGDPPGAAYLLLGPLAGDLDLADAPVRLLGTMTEGNIGTRVDLGDLDGDGLPDLLLQNCDTSCGVEVLNGRASVEAWEDATPSATLLGDSDHSLGFQSALADLDADGHADMVTGAFLGCADEHWCFYCCDFAAYVYSGPVEGTLEVTDATARTDNEQGSMGGALASRDLNGDGADDLVWSWWTWYESYRGIIQTDIFYGGAP
jgi:hypothetical protein